MSAGTGIHWTTEIEFAGTSLRDILTSPWSFTETVARLITLSGQPAVSSDEYKTSVEFTGTFNGETFTLYDYKADEQIHIGGHGDLDVDAFQFVLLAELAKVEPTPYSARLFYDEDKGKTHGWPR